MKNEIKKIIDNLESVLCDSDGNVRIKGSDEDKAIISSSLCSLKELVYPKTDSIFIGIKDKNGIDIKAGDKLLFSYSTISLQGVARKNGKGYWEIYKDDDNHLGIEENKNRIMVIS